MAGKSQSPTGIFALTSTYNQIQLYHSFSINIKILTVPYLKANAFLVRIRADLMGAKMYVEFPVCLQ